MNEAYKNKVQFCDKHIKLAKRKYYAKYFENHKSNSRKQWSMINQLLNRGKHKKHQTIKLNSGDDSSTLITSPKAVAHEFNSYFTSIAGKLINDIPPDQGGTHLEA